MALGKIIGLRTVCSHTHTHTHTRAHAYTWLQTPSHATHANYVWWVNSYLIFHTFRVGGSLPVVFSYFSEYFTPRKKGPLIIVLASFWMLGQVYTALLAWGLLNNPCAIDAQLGSLTLRSWRVFVMLCTVPAITSAVCFIFLPESPSWLYQVHMYCIVLYKCHVVLIMLYACIYPVTMATR